MKEQLIHILDQSVCLSRKQMKEYMSGTMLPEEAHAAEVHLSSCPLCSLAMEGFEEHTEEALVAISALNSGFLKEHFDNISPQIHLNSMAPTATMQMSRSGRKRETQAMPLWRVGSIAAGLLLIFGLVWAFEHRHREASVLTNIESGGAAAGNSGTTGATGHPSTKANTVAASPVNTPGSTTQEIGTSKNDWSSEKKNQSTPATKNTSSSAFAASDKRPMEAGSVASNSAMRSKAPSEPGANSGSVPPLLPTTHAAKEYNPDEDGGKPETNVPRSSSFGSGATKTTTEENPAASDADAINGNDLGDKSYSKGAYEDALPLYKKNMNSNDPHIRYHSMVMAAQCYAALGNKKQAEQLLQRVLDNAPGPERRQARRVMRKLE